jgi:hypothetical protein
MTTKKASPTVKRKRAQKQYTSLALTSELIAQMDAINADIQEASGYTMSRNRIIQVLGQIYIEAAPYIDKESVVDQESLRRVVRKAIVRLAG